MLNFFLQANRGMAYGYNFKGRHHPLSSKPRLRSKLAWSRLPVAWGLSEVLPLKGPSISGLSYVRGSLIPHPMLDQFWTGTGVSSTLKAPCYQRCLFLQDG